MTDTSRSSDYGVVERTRAGDDLAQHAERIRLVGYTVVSSGMSGVEVEQLGARLDEVLARQAEEFGGMDRLDRIGEAFTARCPLAYDDAFLALATNTRLLGVCRQLLGDYVLLMQQNGVINPPRQPHTQVAYHRDLPYQHFVSSRPLAVSALFCIDPFRPDTGATTVLPASHRMEAFPSADVAAVLDTAVEAAPGDYIVFDSMLYHRAGHNRSDRPRRAVNQVFSVPVIAQQISIPRALGGRHADDPTVARLLGYEVDPPGSVVAWRERRAARISDPGSRKPDPGSRP